MADHKSYDLIVIGAGPGGYMASIRAAQLGMKVVCVDKFERPGGVCLNIGCIPSKALLDSSEFYHLAKDRLGRYGIQTDGVNFDLSAMMARKDRVVKELSDGVLGLFKANKVSAIQGMARIAGTDRVEVAPLASGDSSGETVTITAKAILVATGSEPASIPGLPFDGDRIVSSTEALSFESVPEHLGIIGGGYIGLELGSLWRRLGAKVTVIEMLPKIASLLDSQISRYLERVLTKQGITFRLRSRVMNAELVGNGLRLMVESDGKSGEITCEKLLVAAGRRPLSHGLGLEEAGVRIDPRTRQVLVDERYRTSVPGIYAVGDIIPGPMLAHKASAEGIAAVECIAGLPGEVNYDAIPAAIYTSPEVATVGMTEDEAKERGIRYCAGTYPFLGVSRARCIGETDGLIKVITHAATDRILGVHIIGPRASDMIAEAVMVIEFGGTSEDIARTIHGHPTFSEGLHEAALAVRKCSRR